MNKERRINIVNEIILEISSRGRKFFRIEDKVAFMLSKKERIYYHSEWKDARVEEIYISGKGEPIGWHHGGTLLDLIKEFKHWIITGKMREGYYSGLHSDNWGYPQKDMQAIQKKAIELGYVSPRYFETINDKKKLK